MRRALRWYLGLVLVSLGVQAARAQSAACAQARAMVAEIEQMYAAGTVNPKTVLAKAKTATDLCAPLGAAWKYAYCSALALGDRKASFYRDRAVFNEVLERELDCGAGRAVGPRRLEPLPGYVRQKFALVVGISKFRDPEISPLQFASKDARDLVAVLTDPRYGRFESANVTLLTDEQATRTGILDALQAIFSKAREDDLFFLYVSSHGSPRQQELGLQGVGYIATYDSSSKSLWREALEYNYLSEKVSLIKARRKVVFLDTCYSGPEPPKAKGLIVDGQGVDAQTAEMFLSGEGSYIITSSRVSEKSFESEELRNSYFTYYLIAALKTGPQPPTVRQIFDVLSQDVPEAVLRDKGAAQHPQILPTDGRSEVRIGVQPRLTTMPSAPPGKR